MNAKQIDRLARIMIYVIVTGICLVLALIIGYVLVEGLPVLSVHFLTSEAEDFLPGGGIGPELFNSFYLLVLTLIISWPVAWGAAIYLSEYAEDNWFKKALLTSIEVLSSLPSVVVGLFGFLLFVLEFKLSFSILSGALTLMIFNLPTLVRIMEQSLRGIDGGQREAALALGLTRWEAVRKVLMPAALPGITTGFILAAGRIFGEAAALIYTAGQTTSKLEFGLLSLGSHSNAWNIFRPAETLAVHLWKVNSEGIVPDGTAVSNGTAAVLILSVLFFNVAATFVGKALYRRQTGIR